MASHEAKHDAHHDGGQTGAGQTGAGPTSPRRVAQTVARGGVIGLIYVYQGVASVFPKVCRFEPSCSNYGLEAVRVHGAFAGGWLTLKRILRCRPGGGCGIDPVPSANDRAPHQNGGRGDAQG